jgi:hypothetical protein
LIHYIFDIEEKSRSYFPAIAGMNFINQENYLKCLIKIADENPTTKLDPSSRKIALTILRKLVEIKAHQYNKRATEWECEDWAEYKDDVESMQGEI